MKSISCLRCQSAMQLGFIIDGHQNGFAQEAWSPGEPQKSFWLGLKLDRDQMLPVVSYRCLSCGYLESYATKPVAPGK